MKFLVSVLVVCTILLYIPFHIMEYRKTHVYSPGSFGEQVSYIDTYTDSIGDLLLGDIVVFNSDPPHFALVDRQVNGLVRGLMVTSDSALIGGKNLSWLRRAFHYNQLDFQSSPRVIHPNVDDRIRNNEIKAVFRKVKTQFYFRPIFEGVFAIFLLFFFFFCLELLRYLSRWKLAVSFILTALFLLYMSILRYSREMLQYVYGDWQVSLAYMGVSFIVFFTLIYLSDRLGAKRLSKYPERGAKFLLICLFAPLSLFISFKVIELFYPDIVLIALYDKGHLDALTLWSYYYFGYAFALAGLLQFGIEEYRAIQSDKDAAIDDQLDTRAQLNSLQARLNPHFLYNSLNAIASLIKSDPNRAEEITMRVSKFMRHFTNRSMIHLTSISEEIDMIKEYLEIEKVRFGEKLKYNMDISTNALTQRVPRSLLQPLVENAVKYGYNEQEDSISIRLVIVLNGLTVTIKVYDGGNGFDDDLDKGYGLSSVYDKLSLLYGGAYDVSFINQPDKHVVISYETDKLRIDA